MIEKFAGVNHRVDVGDLKLSDGLKKGVERAVEFVVAVPQD